MTDSTTHTTGLGLGLNDSCLVILSGGQDSTTCLYWAKTKFKKVHAVTFDYHQRHSRELQCAVQVAREAHTNSHHLIRVGSVLRGTSPLISEKEVGTYESVHHLPGGVEPTFIPGRNLLFLVLAASHAMSIGTTHLIAGLCEEDYGGYYDCRQPFVKVMEQALGMGLTGDPKGFQVHTPLMHLNKKDTVLLAKDLGAECLHALRLTHTCYQGKYPPCGKCHACLLRSRGFEEAGIPDPLMEGVTDG